MLTDTIEWLAIFQNSENFPDVQVLGTRRQMCDLNCVKFHLKIIQQKFKIVFAFACHFAQSNASRRLGTRQEAQRFFFLTSKSQELTKRIRKKHGKSMCSGKVEILCSHSCFAWTLRVFPSQATSRGFDRHDFLPGWDQMILDSPWFTSAYESWETHLYEKEGRRPDRKSESPRQCTLSVAVVASYTCLDRRSLHSLCASIVDTLPCRSVVSYYTYRCNLSVQVSQWQSSQSRNCSLIRRFQDVSRYFDTGIAWNCGDWVIDTQIHNMQSCLPCSRAVACCSWGYYYPY